MTLFAVPTIHGEISCALRAGVRRLTRWVRPQPLGQSGRDVDEWARRRGLIPLHVRA